MLEHLYPTAQNPSRVVVLGTGGFVVGASVAALRDHVWIEDVAGLVTRSLRHRSRGVLNLATGTVASFREIAEWVVGHFPESVAIHGSPRQGAMPHNGYRPFDPAATRMAFPDFAYTQIVDGLRDVHRQLLEAGA